MIVIWGLGRAGGRYKKIANDFGYTTKVLSDNSTVKVLILMN